MSQYKIEDLRVQKSPLDMIRQNSGRFAGEKPRGPRLISNLVRELILQGSWPIRIDRHEGWWTIVSDRDWLELPQPSESFEPFFQMIRFPAGGLLAIRSEVIITALAEAVVTATFGHLQWIVGNSETTLLPDTLRLSLRSIKGGRLLAFLMNDDGNIETKK
jgi:hypothetical protein